MYLLNQSQQILRDMWSSKLRSILAVFGIAFGTLTVVLLLALGTGFHDASLRNMMGIVDGSFFVRPGKTSLAYQGLPQYRQVYLKPSDIMKLPKVISEIKLATPISRNMVSISAEGKQFSKSIYGVGPAFQVLRKITVEPEGRFFNQADVEYQTRVVVIGNKLKESLFGAESALGKRVLINGVPCAVIGVITAPEKSTYSFYDDNIIMPYTTYTAFFGEDSVRFFMVMPDPDSDASQVERSMRSYFSNIKKFDPSDQEALRIFNTTTIFQFVRFFFLGIQIFLGICGAMTLAVGSIGVANIMFLIVTERTKEIGLRKAVGATDWHILLQLLLESLIIILIGGGSGFLTAYIITVIMQHIALPSWLGAPVISGATVITTIIILAMVGLASGYFPARKAAKMDPVEALML